MISSIRVPLLASASVLSLVLPAPPVRAQADRADPTVIARIQEEGMERSQVMKHVIWLADVHGPRLTGSPGIEQAGEWAQARLREWGLANVREERFPFGRGWSLERFSAHLLEPQIQPIIGMPKSWTHGTGGPVTAEVVLAPIAAEADFERFRGTLAGRIVLTKPARAVNLLEGPVVLPMGEREIEEARTIVDSPMPPAPLPPTAREPAPPPPPPSAQRIQEFYEQDGPIALLDRGADTDVVGGGSDHSWVTQRTDGGTIFVSTMDVVDRIQPDDMRQMATVAAIFAYLTAQRDERIPRTGAQWGQD